MARRQQVYCSPSCDAEAKAWRYLIRSVPIPWVDCSDCGRAFIQKHGVQRCTECRGAKPRLWFMGYCVDCDEPFVTDQPAQVCCSPLCSKRQHRDRRRARQRQAFIEPIYRAKVYERDEWTCQLCGDPVDRSARVPDPLAPTLDHILPLALGGHHSNANVQCAHFICNAKKGASCDDQLKFAA